MRNKLLILPLLVLLASSLIFVSQSSESARLNRHLYDLKYTDFVSIWWQEGKEVVFICTPDDAAKVGQNHGLEIPEKQALYTQIKIPTKDLLKSDSPKQLVNDHLNRTLECGCAIRYAQSSWDDLYKRSQERHFTFRQSNLIYWTALVLSVLQVAVMLMWRYRKQMMAGALICLFGGMFSVWWLYHPPVKLNKPDTVAVWQWEQSECIRVSWF